MSLRQGDMSVGEYIRKFDMGSHFVPLIANDAGENLRHFVDGLKPTIRRDVMMMDPTDYATATTRAFRVEQALKVLRLMHRERGHNRIKRSLSQIRSNPQVLPGFRGIKSLRVSRGS